MLLSLNLGKLVAHMEQLHCVFQSGREEGEVGRLREQCVCSLWFALRCFFYLGFKIFLRILLKNLIRYACLCDISLI